VPATDAAGFLATRGAEFTAVLTGAAIGITPAQMAALPNLKVISSFGVGLDKIDVEAAKARGIAVGYTPDVLNDCVADLAFALLLDVARQTSNADRFVRRGDWLKGAFPLARKVSGAKLGLVGLGRIGRTIAQRSIGFDMAVRYHSRNAVADVAWAHEPSLIELAKWADFLVVITAGGAGTRHMVNAQVLDALGPQGFIVNVARGTVSDEAALMRPCRKSASPVQAWMFSKTNRACPKRCSRWTTWCWCRTSPAPPSKPGRPWPTGCSTTCRPTSAPARPFQTQRNRAVRPHLAR